MSELARTAGSNRSYVALLACCGIIAAISVHDAMLLIVNHETIVEEERNPLGQWLLALQGGEVWLFVVVKLVGTAVVCSTLITLFEWRPPIGMIVASSLTCVQLALLAYLTWG